MLSWAVPLTRATNMSTKGLRGSKRARKKAIIYQYYYTLLYKSTDVAVQGAVSKNEREGSTSVSQKYENGGEDKMRK